METCIELYETFRSTETGVAEGVKNELSLMMGVKVGPRAEVPSVLLFVVHINTFCLYHHQISIDAFDFDNKTLVGCLFYVDISLRVKYWMVFYKKFTCLYNSHEPLAFAMFPTPSPTLSCYRLPAPPCHKVIILMSLTPVFRSRLSASAAALALAHVSARHSGPGLEGTHAVPGLLSHCLGSPALHGWTAAREACLLVFCLTMRVCFGGPSAIEALVGCGGLYSLISSGFLWVTCLALTRLLTTCEPGLEPEPEPEPELLW